MVHPSKIETLIPQYLIRLLKRMKGNRKKKVNPIQKSRTSFESCFFFFLENQPIDSMDPSKVRSSAIAITNSNVPINARSEPFYHPRHASVNGHQVVPSESEQNSDEKKATDDQAEAPRTPHSRAKNLTRFFPVTKDAPVIKPDVNRYFVVFS